MSITFATALSRDRPAWASREVQADGPLGIREIHVHRVADTGRGQRSQDAERQIAMRVEDDHGHLATGR
jgi:hypothetical protein